MSNDLVSVAVLAYLPGAPFTNGEVDAAVAALRSALDWHVAPERTETVSFDVAYQQYRLVLPTRKLVSVDEVRIGADVVDPANYQVSTNLAQIVKSSGYWPSGYGAVEVDITHGYTAVPPDLLPVIAETATSQRLLAVRAPVIEQSAQVGEGVGADIITAAPLTSRLLRRDVLDRYSLRWLPGLA